MEKKIKNIKKKKNNKTKKFKMESGGKSLGFALLLSLLLSLVSSKDYGEDYRQFHENGKSGKGNQLILDTFTRTECPGYREESFNLVYSEWSHGGKSGNYHSPGTGCTVIWGTRKSWMSNREMNREIKAQNGNGTVKQILKVYHWNKGHGWWENKLEEIETLVAEKVPDLIFISEANLRQEIRDEMKCIDGYTTVYPKTATNHKYSRLILLIREEISYKLLDNLMNATEPSIWVRVNINKRRSVCIGGCYREHRLLLQQAPNLTGTPALQQLRWEATIRGWMAAAREKRCFLIGDLNLDYSRWLQPEAGHSRMVDRVKTEIETLGFCQIVRGMTRFWPGQPPSQLDHCWTNSPGLVMSHSNETWSSSDHNLIGVMVRTRDRVEADHESWGRQWKQLDVQRFKRKFRELDWMDFYQCRNINELNEKFVENVRTILDSEAPIKARQYRRNHASWMTEKLKETKGRRDALRNVACTSGREEDWRRFKTVRNNYNKELVRTKNDHYRRQFENYAEERDVKKIFSETKKLLKWKTVGQPKTFLKDGRLWRKPVELASIQIEYFTEKVQKLMDSLAGQQGDPLKYLRMALQRWDGCGKFQSFSFREVTTLEAVNMIGKLGNSTATGIDEIDSMSLKLVTAELTQPIKHIINVSLTESSYANKWKIAKTIPLLKNKDLDKLSPSSYRPVALLTTVSKIVERAAQTQLLDYLEKTRQLNPNSHAYRKGMSTTTTLIQLMDGLYEATDAKKISSLMALDQSCAFDCVRHSLLLDKLRLMNIEEKAITWVGNYLAHRSHFVSVGRAVSGMKPVPRGVPQGSVLGPLLYTIYTSDITESVRDENCQDPVHLENRELFGKGL